MEWCNWGVWDQNCTRWQISFRKMQILFGSFFLKKIQKSEGFFSLTSNKNKTKTEGKTWYYLNNLKCWWFFRKLQLAGFVNCLSQRFVFDDRHQSDKDNENLEKSIDLLKKVRSGQVRSGQQNVHFFSSFLPLTLKPILFQV